MNDVKRPWRQAGLGLIAAAAAALAALQLGGCGSSDSEADAPSATTATTTAAASAAGGSEVAKAKAFLARYAAPPTKLQVTEPLKAKPQAGQLMEWLQCDAAQCKATGDAMRLATQAIGWKFKVINYKAANPATLIAAMQQALQDKPVAVAFTASPYAIWKSQVPAFQKAGVAIIPQYIGPATVNDTVVANIGGKPDIDLAANIIAQWFIADSKASGKAILYSVPDFPALKLYQDSFKQAVADGCAKCEVTLVTQTIPEVLGGKSNAALVSALQKQPDAKYVVLGDYPLTVGLPSSLKAAGLDDVQIAGSYAGRADQQLVKQSLEHAATPQPLNIGAWLTVDAAARHAQGLPVAEGDGGLATQLLVPETIGAPSDSYDEPADYQAQFKALWGVG